MMIPINYCFGDSLPDLYIPYSKEGMQKDNSLDSLVLKDVVWYNFTWTLSVFSDPNNSNSPTTFYNYLVKTAYKHNNTHMLFYMEINDKTRNESVSLDMYKNQKMDGDYVIFRLYEIINGTLNEEEDSKGLLLLNNPIDATSGGTLDSKWGGKNDVFGYGVWNEQKGYTLKIIFPLKSNDYKGRDININQEDKIRAFFFYNDASINWNAYYPRGFTYNFLNESEPVKPTLTMGSPQINGYKVTLNGKFDTGGNRQVSTRFYWGDGLVEEQVFPATHTYGKEGTYEIKVNVFQSGMFISEEKIIVTLLAPRAPAEISVKALQISKTLAKPGEEIEVTATLENVGEVSGNYALKISLDGVEKDSSTVTLDGGKTVTKTVKLSSDAEGVHKVTVDGKSIEFEVKREPSGIDGFPFEVVFIGLMLAVLILGVYRKS
jgi:hypothetical protein